MFKETMKIYNGVREPYGVTQCMNNVLQGTFVYDCDLQKHTGELDDINSIEVLTRAMHKRGLVLTPITVVPPLFGFALIFHNLEENHWSCMRKVVVEADWCVDDCIAEPWFRFFPGDDTVARFLNEEVLHEHVNEYIRKGLDVFSVSGNVKTRWIWPNTEIGDWVEWMDTTILRSPEVTVQSTEENTLLAEKNTRWEAETTSELFGFGGWGVSGWWEVSYVPPPVFVYDYDTETEWEVAYDLPPVIVYDYYTENEGEDEDEDVPAPYDDQTEGEDVPEPYDDQTEGEDDGEGEDGDGEDQGEDQGEDEDEDDDNNNEEEDDDDNNDEDGEEDADEDGDSDSS